MKDLQYRVKYNRENACYCLSNTVNIILKRQRYKNKAKWFSEEGQPKQLTGFSINIYEKASKKSKIVHTLKNSLEYTFLIEFKTGSLDSDSCFYSVAGDESSKGWASLDISGYLCEDDLNEELIKIFDS